MASIVFGLDNVMLSLFSNEIVGEFNGDGWLDVADLDALNAEIRAGTNDPHFDLNSDGIVDVADRTIWITDIKNTSPGDTNLDGQVDSLDLNSLALTSSSDAVF